MAFQRLPGQGRAIVSRLLQVSCRSGFRRQGVHYSTAASTRTESDTFGSLQIPAGRYWGAETQRTLQNFKAGRATDLMPEAVVRALGVHKRAAAKVNMELSVLDKERGNAIVRAATEVADGKLLNNFPLVIWRTGRGSHSNTTANEVIANRATEILGGQLGDKSVVHPDDHVNKGQSSNDAVRTVTSVTLSAAVQGLLQPALTRLADAIQVPPGEAGKYGHIIKTGGTHILDASLTSANTNYTDLALQVWINVLRLKWDLDWLLSQFQGGSTIVGFAEKFADEIAKDTGCAGYPFVAADANPGLVLYNAIVGVRSAVSTTAVSVMKVVNEIPVPGGSSRSGLGEVLLPAPEPGPVAPRVPGKGTLAAVQNLSMVAAEVFGNHSVTVAGSMAQFDYAMINAAVTETTISSISMLVQAIDLYTESLVPSTRANEKRPISC